jgi:hypothetical protein
MAYVRLKLLDKYEEVVAQNSNYNVVFMSFILRKDIILIKNQLIPEGIKEREQDPPRDQHFGAKQCTWILVLSSHLRMNIVLNILKDIKT